MNKYIRLKSFKLNSGILESVLFSPLKWVFLNGYLIRNKHIKYKVFHKNKNCYLCGIRGKFFALEKVKGNRKKACFINLYAMDKNRNEVLMTLDHVKPLSKGGQNIISNLNTCCYICNQKKGDNLINNV